METLLAHCGRIFFEHGGMLAMFFIGGLAGSLTHCLLMCGPGVACQAACASACGQRFAKRTQWHYHLGRMLSYGALGFAAATVSAQLQAFAFWPWLSALLLALAGVLFLSSAMFSHSSRHGLRGSHLFLRGALMGFMPCGLLYAALMAAAAMANPWQAMLAMWLFMLGTLPVLLLSSSAAVMMAKRWHLLMGRVGRLGMACNGLALVALAGKLVR